MYQDGLPIPVVYFILDKSGPIIESHTSRFGLRLAYLFLRSLDRPRYIGFK